MIEHTSQQPTIRPATGTVAAAIVTDLEPRCWRCKRMLAWKATRPWGIQCGRCHAENSSPPT